MGVVIQPYASHPLLNGLRLNPLAAPPTNPQPGDMWWTAGDGTVSIQTEYPDVVLQIGQESQTPPVMNDSGVDILNGDVVFIAGAASGFPLVQHARADDPLAGRKTIGIATHDILDTATGKITTFGLVRGLDTSLYPEGTELFLSPSVDGGWITTAPVLPEIAISLGYVMCQCVDDGIIFVRIHVQPVEVVNIPFMASNPGNVTIDNLGHYDEDQEVAVVISDVAPHVSTVQHINSAPVIEVTVLSAPLTLRLAGTSKDEVDGTETPADTEDIAITATGFYQGGKKWLGAPTYSVATAGESMTYSLHLIRYWDANNTDFRLIGFRCQFTPSQAGWSFRLKVDKLNNNGTLTSIYDKTFTSADPTPRADVGRTGTITRKSLVEDFEGAVREGLIISTSSDKIGHVYGDLKVVIK